MEESSKSLPNKVLTIKFSKSFVSQTCFIATSRLVGTERQRKRKNGRRRSYTRYCLNGPRDSKSSRAFGILAVGGWPQQAPLRRLRGYAKGKKQTRLPRHCEEFLDFKLFEKALPREETNELGVQLQGLFPLTTLTDTQKKKVAGPRKTWEGPCKNYTYRHAKNTTLH